MKEFLLGVVVTVLAGWLVALRGYVPVSEMYASPSQCWSTQLQKHANDIRYRCVALLVYHP